MAGAYSASASLQTGERLMPRALLVRPVENPDRRTRIVRQPSQVAMRDRSAEPAASAMQAGKAARLAAAAVIAAETVDQRFDRVAARVALTREKMAEAFARSGPSVAQVQEPLRPPAVERFDAEQVLAALAPDADRLGPIIAAADTPSDIALALARSLALDSAEDLLADAEQERAGRKRANAAMAALSDSAARRPKTEAGPRSLPIRRSSRDETPVLAYADPNDSATSITGAFRSLFTAPSPKSGTAIYDISAKTVYLPDGQKLEAHSGLGGMVDDPQFVHKKNTGPTPPNTYRLVMRESRFHGVEAIRLLPVNGKNKFGRDGLLAHTYMLRGGRAESNGCVVFRDYARFLTAFKKGKVSHLIVVPGRAKTGTRVASNGRGA